MILESKTILISVEYKVKKEKFESVLFNHQIKILTKLSVNQDKENRLDKAIM